MLQRRSLVALAALAALAACLLPLGHSQVHTQVEILDDTCDAQLQELWFLYTAPPTAPVAGCDRDCLAACYKTLQWGIYSEKQQDCPTQDAMIACFYPYRAQWYKFVESCALFQWGTAAGSAEGGEGEGGGSSSSSSAEGEAAPAEGEASTEAGAPSPAEAAPEAAGEAQDEAAPVTAGRRRTLLQEAEAAAADGTVNVYNGCFPSFESSEAFEAYMEGEFLGWETSSPAVGITLSCLFFATLLLTGFGLPGFVKRPLKKASAWVKATIFAPIGAFLAMLFAPVFRALGRLFAPVWAALGKVFGPVFRAIGGFFSKCGALIEKACLSLFACCACSRPRKAAKCEPTMLPAPTAPGAADAVAPTAPAS